MASTKESQQPKIIPERESHLIDVSAERMITKYQYDSVESSVMKKYADKSNHL